MRLDQAPHAPFDSNECFAPAGSADVWCEDAEGADGLGQEDPGPVEDPDGEQQGSTGQPDTQDTARLAADNARMKKALAKLQAKESERAAAEAAQAEEQRLAALSVEARAAEERAELAAQLKAAQDRLEGEKLLSQFKDISGLNRKVAKAVLSDYDPDRHESLEAFLEEAQSGDWKDAFPKKRTRPPADVPDAPGLPGTGRSPVKPVPEKSISDWMGLAQGDRRKAVEYARMAANGQDPYLASVGL